MTVSPSSQPNDNPAFVSDHDPALVVDMITAGDTCVIHVTGELDLATRDELVSATTGGHHSSVVIDLARVTFMDCSGYRSLVASKLVIEGEARSFALAGQTGQPARLLELIAELDNGGDEPTTGAAQ